MTSKKNKFSTFYFSLIPGAGEMYLGFYKMGISLVRIFGIVSALSRVLNLPVFMFPLPVIWSYNFLHVHNLNGLPDEEFYAQEDYWIVPFDPNTSVFNDWFCKYRKLAVGILILFGISILWNILTDFTREMTWMLHVSDILRNFTFRASNTIPQGVITLLIIVLGIRMTKSKKEDLDLDNGAIILSPPYIEVEPETEKRVEDKKSEENQWTCRADKGHLARTLVGRSFV